MKRGIMFTLVKYFFIVISSLYCYYRFQNKASVYHSHIVFFLIYTFVISLAATLLFAFVFPCTVLFTYSMTLYCLLLKDFINYKFLTITYTISYMFNYCLLSVCYSICLLFFLPFKLPLDVEALLCCLISSFFCFIIIKLIFKIKRFSNGFSIYANSKAMYLGFIISLTLLLSAIFLNITSYTYNVGLISLILLIYSGLFILLIWWKNLLKKLYIRNATRQNLELLNQKLISCENQIKQLENSNISMAAIIHRDNKLIPAMELAVENLLKVSYTNPDDLKAKSNELLQELKVLSADRTGLLHDYKTISIPLSPTGICSTDLQLTYIYQKAVQNNISFELTVSPDFKSVFSSKTITEKDLNTLLMDLLDNAIIACKHSDSKQIHLNLNFDETTYSIICYDSGIPFTNKTLKHLGTVPYTTHADSGGSGIGFMSIFNITNTCNASIVINQYLENNIYTKSISILFDKKHIYFYNTI